MVKEDQKEKKVKTNWNDVIANGAAYFQSNGSMGRLEFLSVFVLWSIISGLGAIGLWHLMNLAAFVSIIFAIQKRCRDLHYKGTIFILFFSLWMCLLQWWSYGEANDLPTIIESVIPFYTAMIVIQLFYLYLIFMPGKKEKTFTETSILLKYPTLYFGIWSIIYFVGFYALFGKII